MNNRYIKVLIAEDESSLALILKESLETQNMLVEVYSDGVAALKAYQQNPPDILIIDIMMPFKDGLTLTKEIRKSDISTPIILLTARSLSSDVVSGFNAGCNDYIRKPFSIEELLVRIKALIQRTLSEKEEISTVTIGDYIFCPTKQMLTYKQKTEMLTHREAALLTMLSRKRNEIINRSEILNILWKNEDFFVGRSLDVFITKLRRKLALDTSIQIINVRGIGYKLVS
jgi:DNA-binding response OmpR family regulator